ncbi:MAG: methylaspartate mutase accessory protein GlmL [Corallococcus sp.]|nr:methylaspartate mutase accessory protein GlmL [Corallococcus sp.]
MSRYLMIDFGSTFTKLTAVDTEKEDIIATASHFTTVATDITIGYRNALKQLYEVLGEEVKFDKTIGCSSAAGGLKMCAIGLVDELTLEAARRVCLGAGAKVDLSFSHHLTNRNIDEIIEKKIDIILLSGGTDGGNSECVLYNEKMLAERGIKIPIIYAGNKDCQDEVIDVAEKYGLNEYVCSNVMPRLNVLNIPEAREKIREIFLKNIIEAKGIKKIESEIDKVILPTPESVLKAAELLSNGYMHESGLGEVVLVDIGGATTDMYSMCSASAKRSDVVIKGLEEPYAKRTVEGDLGMRYSALGVLNSLTEEEQKTISLDEGVDLKKELLYRHEHVDNVPHSQHEVHIDRIMGRICVDKAMSRHVGRMEELYTPMGMVYNQYGKDLSKIRYVIGTGGVLVRNENPYEILKALEYDVKKPMELRPVNPKYLLDADYILAAMGLLSEIDPLLALKIMKKHLKPIDAEPDEKKLDAEFHEIKTPSCGCLN